MTIKYYNSLKRKKSLVKAANKRGESTVHDDFIDVNGNATDGKSGRLTFEVIVSTPDPNFIRKKELTGKLQDDSMTFSELKELERLERGL